MGVHPSDDAHRAPGSPVGTEQIRSGILARCRGARGDWATLLDPLIEGDRLAFLKWSRKVTSWFAGWRASDFRAEWADRKFKGPLLGRKEGFECPIRTAAKFHTRCCGRTYASG